MEHEVRHRQSKTSRRQEKNMSYLILHQWRNKGSGRGYSEAQRKLKTQNSYFIVD